MLKLTFLIHHAETGLATSIPASTASFEASSFTSNTIPRSTARSPAR